MTDQRVRQLTRMTKTQLAAEHKRVLAAKGHVLVYGGPRTKDEFINEILSEEVAS